MLSSTPHKKLKLKEGIIAVSTLAIFYSVADRTISSSCCSIYGDAQLSISVWKWYHSLPTRQVQGRDVTKMNGMLITCNNSFNLGRPFLNKFSLQLQEISLQPALVKHNCTIASNCPEQEMSTVWTSTNFRGARLNFSRIDNKFTVVGCDNALFTYDGEAIAGCTSRCKSGTNMNGC